MPLALKATLAHGSPVHAFAWDLPTRSEDGEWTPGAWARVEGAIEYRRNGLHVCSSAQVGYWRGHLGAKGSAAVVWVAEYRGAVSAGKNGWAAQEVRLLRPWTGEAIEGLAPVSYAETIAARIAAVCPKLDAEGVARVADCVASYENGRTEAADRKRKSLCASEKRAVTKALRSK